MRDSGQLGPSGAQGKGKMADDGTKKPAGDKMGRIL